MTGDADMTPWQRTWAALLGLWLVVVLFWAAFPMGRADAAESGCQAAVTHRHWCTQVVPVGHRGRHGPNEDTLAALRVVDSVGGSWENDTWNTRDGVPVVMHDNTLRRTVDPATMPPGVTPDSRPGDLTIDQWRLLRTYAGEPLPTLYQWLRYAGRHQTPGMVEIKWGFRDPAQVVGWVQRFNAPVTFYVQPQAGACQQTAAATMLRAGAVVGLKSYGCTITLEEAAAFGYSYVITSTKNLTAPYVGEAHSLGLKVGCFLSGNPDQWATLVQNRTDYILAPHIRVLTRWLGTVPS